MKRLRKGKSKKNLLLLTCLLIGLVAIVLCCGFGTSKTAYPVDWKYYEDFKNLLKTTSTAFNDSSEEQYKEMYKDWYYNYAFSDILVTEDRKDVEMVSDAISIYDATYPSMNTLMDGVYSLSTVEENKNATVMISTKEDITKIVYNVRFTDGTLSHYVVDDLKYDSYSGWYMSQSENVSMKWNKDTQLLYIEDQNNEKEDPNIYMTGGYVLIIPYYE